jgi:ABC-2 type transport system ATP-binding protein
MIKINNIDFAYGKKAKLFDRLNLNLEKGKIYGLLGKNGTGKSSLLKLMQGLLFTQAGSIEINQYKPSERSPNFLQEVYFLPEEYQLPAISVLKYAELYGKFYPKFDFPKYEELIKYFELSSDENIQQLSFGNKKKVLISFALACKSTFLFLDEPTNGLDIPTKTQLRKLFAKEISEDQCVVISTHQIRDLAQLMESIIILNNGQIVLAQDLNVIEEKLKFQYDSNAQIEGSLYAEKAPGSFVHIMPNPQNVPSELDLEILFNAVLENSDSILKQFN